MKKLRCWNIALTINHSLWNTAGWIKQGFLLFPISCAYKASEEAEGSHSAWLYCPRHANAPGSRIQNSKLRRHRAVFGGVWRGSGAGYGSHLVWCWGIALRGCSAWASRWAAGAQGLPAEPLLEGLRTGLLLASSSHASFVWVAHVGQGAKFWFSSPGSWLTPGRRKVVSGKGLEPPAWFPRGPAGEERLVWDPVGSKVQGPEHSPWSEGLSNLPY